MPGQGHRAFLALGLAGFASARCVHFAGDQRRHGGVPQRHGRSGCTPACLTPQRGRDAFSRVGLYVAAGKFECPPARRLR